MAGQFFPVYFEHAETQRVEIAELIDNVVAKGVDVENTIPSLMKVAGDKLPADEAAVGALNARMLDLFQTIESVSVELPDSQVDGRQYVDSMLQLREAAASLNGSLHASEFVEAASAFKHARTRYEGKLDDLEPTFFESVLRSL